MFCHQCEMESSEMVIRKFYQEPARPSLHQQIFRHQSLDKRDQSMLFYKTHAFDMK